MNDDKHNHIAPQGPVKKAVREHSDDWAEADRRRRDAANEDDRAMDGGSNEDRRERAGARDVTEGTTGGTGTEVGGSRNFRTGTGATGSDIGNRPE